MAKEQEGALSGYRVLDLADSKGAYGTKLFADLGANVIKIERPEGDPGRAMPPFVDDVPHPKKSLYFLHRNAGKRGITLNLDTEEGRDIFKKLIAGVVRLITAQATAPKRQYWVPARVVTV